MQQYSDIVLNFKKQVPQWDIVQPFIESANLSYTSIFKQVITLIRKSDRVLKYLGGDPMRWDWNRFRPLRLSREEDWSDWLAFLIERSNGSFNRLFLPHPDFLNADFTAPRVEREVPMEGYRSDLIIKWVNNTADHIEVKVGDTSIEKTFGTSMAMKKKYGGKIRSWKDWILLLDFQLDSWEEVAISEGGKEEFTNVIITPRIWMDVAISIRKCLYEKLESCLWNAWGYAFAGSIESRLYNASKIENINDKGNTFRISSGIISQFTILSRSMGNE